MPRGTRLITGTGRLLTPEPFPGQAPWAITVTDGLVSWVGGLAEAPQCDEVISLGDGLVTPGLVDAHTHPVYAGERSDEAAARLAGQPYSGGGILRTVAATRAASDDQLEALAEERLLKQLSVGTTTVECKSGYGLATDEELRHLRIITTVAERLPVRVVRTLLGAHARPPEAADYVSEVVEQMIPAAADEGLAEFCDVFCDDGFFTVDEAKRILEAAAARGLGLRIHADQLAAIGATSLAIRLGAISADHLEQLDGPDLEALARSSTVATLLPGPAVVLRDRLPPARRLLDAGATVALASDANAGTFGAWGAMPLVIGLACTVLGMTAAEAVRAATSGGAASLDLRGLGEIAPGADADLVEWDADHEGAFALRLGSVVPRRVLVAGQEVAFG